MNIPFFNVNAFEVLERDALNTKSKLHRDYAHALKETCSFEMSEAFALSAESALLRCYFNWSVVSTPVAV